jgi:hypothetical protein
MGSERARLPEPAEKLKLDLVFGWRSGSPLRYIAFFQCRLQPLRGGRIANKKAARASGFTASILFCSVSRNLVLREREIQPSRKDNVVVFCSGRRV